MARTEDEALELALRTALELADAARDTLIAAKIADCLWVLSRRTDDRNPSGS